MRSTIHAFPFQIGDWVGVDVPQPAAAVTLLKPNALVSRRYHNRNFRFDIVVLIVQCRDARDMVGHYPPICYPSNGWTRGITYAKDWHIDDLDVPGTEYNFSRHGTRQPSALTIANFMILPNGTIGRGIEHVNKAAKNYQSQALGAAQLQIVCDAEMPQNEREETIQLFIEACRPVINEMRTEIRQ